MSFDFGMIAQRVLGFQAVSLKITQKYDYTCCIGNYWVSQTVFMMI